MNNQQLKEFRTKFGNIKASQSSSRLSNLPAMIDDATANAVGGTATVKERPPVPRPASQGASSMVELKPAISHTFSESPVTGLGASPKTQGAAPPLTVAHPWQPTNQLTMPNTQLMAAPVASRPDVKEHRMQDVLEQLQSHAEQITPLSMDQELALREFQKLARDLKAIGRENGVFVEIDDFLDWSNLASQAPRVERSGANSFLITTKLIDLRRARHDAETNAETVRRLQHSTPRSKSRSGFSSELTQAVSLAQWVWQRVQSLVEPRPASKARRVVSRTAQPAAEPKISVQSSAFWFGGAVVVRLGLDLMLASNPSLWLVAIAVIAAPAVVALLRVTRAPQTGFAMGVNLFLIMIGLLVGGRF